MVDRYGIKNTCTGQWLSKNGWGPLDAQNTLVYDDDLEAEETINESEHPSWMKPYDKTDMRVQKIWLVTE